MAYPAYIREKARQLRRDKKLTIDELAECLALPRTTIYYWVGDIPIPTTPRQIVSADRGRRLGNQRMREKYRRLREAAYDEGLSSFVPLMLQSGFRDFVCLFIAEGYKRNRNRVSIANSDPAVVKVADHWLRRLSSNAVGYSVQYHADQDLQALRRFWGELLGVDPAAIRLQRKSNTNGLAARTWRSPYGVLTVEANDTYLRAELQAWMDWIQGEWLDSALIGA
jgi:hypothetical protein